MDQGIEVRQNAFEKIRQRMLDKTTTGIAALARSATPILVQAQVDRWDSEGGSEGYPWAALTPNYQKRKVKIAAKHGYPFAGSKMMVLSGTLFKAAILEDLAFAGRIIEPNKFGMYIKTGDSGIPYASFANDARQFNKFSQDTKDKIKAEIRKYFMEE